MIASSRLSFLQHGVHNGVVIYARCTGLLCRSCVTMRCSVLVVLCCLFASDASQRHDLASSDRQKLCKMMSTMLCGPCVGPVLLWAAAHLPVARSCSLWNANPSKAHLDFRGLVGATCPACPGWLWRPGCCMVATCRTTELFSLDVVGNVLVAYFEWSAAQLLRRLLCGPVVLLPGETPSSLQQRRQGSCCVPETCAH